MEHLDPTSAPQATESAPPQLALVPEPKPDLLGENNRLKAEIAAVKEQLENARGQARDLRIHLEQLEENPLHFALLHLDAGVAYDEMGKKLAGMFDLVQQRGEKGTFVLKISAKPLKGAVVYSADVKITEPKLDPEQGIAYVVDGKLTRQDPRQAEFGFSRGDRSSPADEHPYGKDREE